MYSDGQASYKHEHEHEHGHAVGYGGGSEANQIPMDFAQCLVPQSIGVAAYTTAATFGGLVLLCGWIVRQGRFVGRNHFLRCIVGLLWWLAMAFFEITSIELSCKIRFAQLAWIAIGLVPVSWILFVEAYCIGREAVMSRLSNITAIVAVSFIATSALTNDLHHQFYALGTRLEERDGVLSGVFEHGPLFYLCTAIVYLYLAGSVLLVATAAFKALPEQRLHLLMMLFVTIAPYFANIGYIAFGLTVFGFDPTPFAFSFILLIFTWAVFANRMFDLATIARDIIYFSISEPIVVTNSQGEVAGLNPAAQSLFPAARFGQAVPLPELDGAIRSVMREPSIPSERQLDVEEGGRFFGVRLIPIKRALNGSSAPLGVVAVMSDVTDVRENQDQLERALDRAQNQFVALTRQYDDAERRALTDPLTSLGNRRAYELACKAILNSGNMTDAVAILDIDYFKHINDRYGHAAGDRVLREFSARLVQDLPQGVLSFRLGGEEFLLLWPGRDLAAMVELTRMTANRITQMVKGQHPATAKLTISAGVAARPADGNSFERLYSIADHRLYEAKRTGRARLVFDHVPVASNGGQARTPGVVRLGMSGPDLEEVTDPIDLKRIRRVAGAQTGLTPIISAFTRASAGQLDEAIDQALAFLGEFCAADRVYVFRVNSGRTVSNTHEWVREGIEPQKDALQELPISIIDPWIPDFEQGDPVDVPDVLALPPNDPLTLALKSQNIHALVVLPLLSGKRLIGFVGLDAVNSRTHFDTVETALLRSVGDVMALALSRAQPRQERDRLSDVFEAMTNLVAILDQRQCVVWANKAFEQISGYGRDELVSKPYLEVMCPPEAELSNLRAAMNRHEPYDGELPRRSRDGQIYWVQIRAQPLHSRDGGAEGYIFIETPLSERKAIKQVFEQCDAFSTGIVRTSPSGIVAMNRLDKVIFANKTAHRLLGLTGVPGFVAEPTEWPLHLQNLDSSRVEDEALPWKEAARQNCDVQDRSYQAVDSAGDVRILSINAAPMTVHAGDGSVVVSITDITELSQTSSRLSQLAGEDPLTGLANRRALKEAAVRELEASTVSGSPFALIMCDLDNFKSVNDMLRHEQGDAILQMAAKRLSSRLGTRGLVARMGGDEFMALAPSMDEDAAIAVAEELREAIAEPFVIGPNIINLTASAGIALYPKHGTELPRLVTSADIALFSAKQAGRNRAVVVSDSLFNAEERRATIAQALGSATLSDALVFHFQPQFLLDQDCSLAGAEALLRWRHPTLGDVGPGEFIPIAEQTGVIHRIDQYVLEQTTRQLACWQSRGWSHRLSINMSGQSFTRHGFAEMVLQQLEKNGVAPGLLTIEITETMLVALSSIAEDNISRLKAAGVAIAIDDFGTGYASLTYVQRLDVTEIKIDRIFVQGLGAAESAESEQLIRAIIGMAQSLGMIVTAEGVETELQREWLTAAGCGRIQGVLTGSAMPMDCFEDKYVPQSARAAS